MKDRSGRRSSSQDSTQVVELIRRNNEQASYPKSKSGDLAKQKSDTSVQTAGTDDNVHTSLRSKLMSVRDDHSLRLARSHIDADAAIITQSSKHPRAPER